METHPSASMPARLVVSVNAGRIADLFPGAGGKRRIATGIYKHPLAGPAMVGRLGLTGDEQADTRLHGGPNKAVYAYPLEHYAFWEAQSRRLARREGGYGHGALGENLTLRGLLETEVWVGDTLEIGETLLEVTEPRQPCFKLNARLGLPQAARLMTQSGHTGFYLRVLRPGMLQEGDSVLLLPGPRNLSIAEINDRHRRGRQSDLFE
jgi:MOSC domain-containing protein YiiM